MSSSGYRFAMKSIFTLFYRTATISKGTQPREASLMVHQSRLEFKMAMCILDYERNSFLFYE